jgi:hypothetical protein
MGDAGRGVRPSVQSCSVSANEPRSRPSPTSLRADREESHSGRASDACADDPGFLSQWLPVQSRHGPGDWARGAVRSRDRPCARGPAPTCQPERDLAVPDLVLRPSETLSNALEHSVAKHDLDFLARPCPARGATPHRTRSCGRAKPRLRSLPDRASPTLSQPARQSRRRAPGSTMPDHGCREEQSCRGAHAPASLWNPFCWSPCGHIRVSDGPAKLNRSAARALPTLLDRG